MRLGITGENTGPAGFSGESSLISVHVSAEAGRLGGRAVEPVLQPGNSESRTEADQHQFERRNSAEDQQLDSGRGHIRDCKAGYEFLRRGVEGIKTENLLPDSTSANFPQKSKRTAGKAGADSKVRAGIRLKSGFEN